jgi:RNA polymerase sigma-70 factor, ECF subfamily
MSAITNALNVWSPRIPSVCNVTKKGRRRGVPSQAQQAPTFDELVAPYLQRTFRATYRITRNREDAQDAVQDALLQAFVHFKDFDGRSSFGTWLTRIAINSALMLLRKKRNSRTFSFESTNGSQETEAFLELKDHTPDAESRYLEEERARTVRDAITSLRPSLRRVIELQQLEERSMKETAEMMGLSVGAAKTRLFHARQALRRARGLRALFSGDYGRLTGRAATTE